LIPETCLAFPYRHRTHRNKIRFQTSGFRFQENNIRDYRKLRAFELADQLVLAIYKCTKSFPKEEMFGLTSQIRRAAVSVPSNIVEGCAKSSQADYSRFLEIAYGSVCEVEYQLSLAERLGFLESQSAKETISLANETGRVLNGLLRSLKSDS
ncbi:MAG: four helix bundle protein, partial [Pirellulaceae bacterium]